MKQKSFWVVTSFYNPAGYQRRIENYHVFRRNLSVPLLAIELAEPGHHQLNHGDADQLVRVTGNDRIWQKERLLNIAINSLPEEAKFFAWVDCDVIFDNPDWASDAQSMLRAGKSFVQLFETASHLPPQPISEQVSLVTCRTTEPLFSEQSFASSVLSGTFFSVNNRPGRTELEIGESAPSGILPLAHGIGWAGHRDLIQEIGLYDACVIGGGDTAMALSSIGCADMLSLVRPMTDSQVHHYLTWARRLNGANTEQVGCVLGHVFHLWHGHFVHRNYRSRHDLLKYLAFNPYNDLVMEENGTWRWATHASDLQSAVGDYFFARLEDQVKK